MQLVIGWGVLILGGLLYFAQIVSSANFELAQRLGIQENPEDADPLLQRAERYTAYWDLVTLGWLPLSGILMIINHEWWPIMSLFGGAIYLDTAGREAAKMMSFRKEGLKIGTAKQRKVFFASYIAMLLIAIIVIAYSIRALVSDL